MHALHYVPERRGWDFDIIEDIIPLYDVPVSVRSPARVTEVRLVPQGEVLQFQEKDGRVEL